MSPVFTFLMTVLFNTLVQSIEALSSLNKRLILLGDFDAPNIVWSNLSASITTSAMLRDLIFRFNFTQVITEPTHINGGILDLPITNIEDHINNIIIENKTSALSSDNFITFVTNMIPHIKKTTRYVLDFSKCDLQGLSNHFLDVDFIPCFASNDIDNSLQLLRSIILYACSLYTHG